MALTLVQQFLEVVKDKKHILVTFDKQQKNDAIASAIALSLFLNKTNKKVDIISSDFKAPKTLGFLPHISTIKHEPSYLQQFVVTLDISESGIKELSYDVKDDQLRIFVTPKKGTFKNEQLATGKTDFVYDLIIAVGTPDLFALGDLYTQNTNLFLDTPIVNIDAHNANERYGHLNITDVMASTTAEIVLNLIKQIDNNAIDAEISNALLTGIISHTQSFKGEQVSPKTLAAASELITYGADRELIIKNLYRTRSVSTLKLWGQALSSLVHHKEVDLVTAVLTKQDILRSGASIDDIPELIEQLIGNSPEATKILLLFEDPISTEYKVNGIFTSDKNKNSLELLKHYSPTGDDYQAEFIVDRTPIERVKENVISLFKNN